MQDFVNRRKKVLELMRGVAAFAQSQNREDIYSDISYEARYLAEGKLTLMVAGEFKRGKSSLINMLLAEQDLCPVAVHITTCAVTVITYGQQERITVYFRREDDPTEFGVKEGDKGLEITREQLKDYCSEQYNQKNEKRVNLIKVELPHQLLEKGLVIVDTPGVGGLYHEHSLITMGFMSSADAMLFVCDAENPVAKSEIQFLQRATEYTKNFVFAMTHKDRVADYEKVQEENCHKITNGLELNSDQVKIIPVSSTLKQQYLTTGIEDYLDNSNYPELEQEIWDMLTGRGGSILMLRALLVTDAAVSEMKQPIADELTILNAKDKKALQLLEIEISKLKQQLEKQNSKQAEWRSELTTGIRHISNDISAILSKSFSSIRNNLALYIDKDNLLDKPDEVYQLMVQDIQDNNVKIGRKFGEMVTALTERIERSVGISMNSFDGSSGIFEVSTPVFEENFNKKNTWEYTRNIVIGAGIGGAVGHGLIAAVGGTIGGIAGFFGGAGVGAVPGAIAGAQAAVAISGSIGLLFSGVAALFGAKRQFDKTEEIEKEQRKRKLMGKLEPILRDAQTDSDKWIKATMIEMESSILQDFINQLTKRFEQIKETEQKLHAAYTTSKADAAKRSATLQPANQVLVGYQREIATQIRSIKQNTDKTAS